MIALAALALVAATGTAAPRLDVGLDERVGARLPADLTFTGADGRPVTTGALFAAHRPVVLALAYARCEALCGVVLHALADAVRTSRLAAGDDYLPVIVSLDPRETAADAARRQARLRADAGLSAGRTVWPYLVGDAPSIHALADALGIRYAWDPATRQFAHPAVVVVVGPDRRIAEYLRGVVFDGLDPAIARAARGELSPSAARDLLACFHLDPALRRYARRLGLLFALGGGTVLAALAALVGWLVVLERRRAR